MISLLNSHNFNTIAKFSVGLICIKEKDEGENSDKINKELAFNVSFSNLCQISNFIVLILGFKFKQELDNHIHSKNNIEADIQNVQLSIRFRHICGCDIGINI